MSDIEQKPNVTAQATPKSTEQATPKIEKPKKITLVLMTLLFLSGTGVILWAWQIKPFNSSIEKTDNSYIRGNSTVLSSQINGYVDQVLVKDFDYVKKDQVLLSINSDNYNQQVVQAESAVTQAQTNLANQAQVIEQRKADIKVAQTKINQALTQLNLSQKRLHRLSTLVDMGAVSQAEIDTAKANVDNNLAAVELAKASMQAAQQALKTAQVAQIGLKAQVDSANAQVAQANTQKNYSKVVAPPFLVNSDK